ncbi:MAG: signal peptidase II [Candidatus Omnitrophica bacterium]|nr:signal peptidase II [Candidatus Omnitrophota bacterium]
MGKLSLAISLILLDQASKIAIIKKLHQNESIPVVANIFHLTLVYNSGSAFGLFRNQNWILIYITVSAIIFILYLLVRRPKFRSAKYLTLWQFSLLFILCGATGNLIDRLKFGYIVDFLDFRIWPIFNFADILITTGVLLLLFVFFKKGAFK